MADEETPAELPPMEAEAEAKEPDAAVAVEGQTDTGPGEAEEGADDEKEDPVEEELTIAARIAKDPLERGFIVPLPEKVLWQNIPWLSDTKN